MNDAGNTPRLVGRQCVHGVDEDRLDAVLTCILAAVFKDRIEEAFRLAGAGARGDDCGQPPRKPTESDALMAMGRMTKGNFRKRLAAFRGTLEGQVD